MKNVLVLGAGLVSRPLVRYLLERSSARVLVASVNDDRGAQLVDGHPRGQSRHLDVANERALDGAVREADLVVSLLPYTLHARVARLAIRHRRPLITTSYVSPEMRSLDSLARQAGVLLLNEVGLDPGLDHMSATHLVDRVRAAGGRITHFSSCCGGLPAEDSNDNPWGYKFSWSPRGVLLAGRNPARFLRDGSVVEIEGRELFSFRWPIQVDGIGVLEVYPNRDCLSYERTYRLAGIRNLFRGTIRHPGWCETLGAAAAIGLLDAEERTWSEGASWADLTTRLLPGAAGSPRPRLARRLGVPAGHPLIERFAWAGLLSPEPLPRSRASALDLFCERLQQRMRYAPGERDMVVMRHDLRFEAAGGGIEHVESSLIAYGIPDGDSAMARTVSLPAAIAARLILEGKIRAVGVVLPVEPEVYRPVLAEVDELGIRFRETRRREAGARRG